MIKILVVDDHAVVRAGVQYFVANIPDMQIGGEAATAQEALAADLVNAIQTIWR